MIDTHQHVWLLGRPECTWPTAAESEIYRDFTPADYAAVAAELGIERSILVQSQESAADTEWLLDLLLSNPKIAGVVGWADMEDPAAEDRLEALAMCRGLLGLRPMVQNREAHWYDRADARRGLRNMVRLGLRLDALVRVQHLPSLARLAQAEPDLAIVIDHAAKPRIGDADGYATWYEAIAPLAELPNLWCKLSGLFTEAPARMRNAEGMKPYVESLLRLFGGERLMWGSDWPVVEGAGGIAEWLRCCRDLVPAGMHHLVFAGTARRFYGFAEEGGA